MIYVTLCYGDAMRVAREEPDRIGNWGNRRFCVYDAKKRDEIVRLPKLAPCPHWQKVQALALELR